ncbi:MAG: NGG1p interacting factor NIF3 [Porticoccaceae bacterium]
MASRAAPAYKLCFYVPASHLDAVKQAVFAAGAGRIGAYDNCCWQVLGDGQFRPLTGSTPHLGVHGRVEMVPEYRVEMVCAQDCIPAVIAALRAAHPYEEPAFDLLRLAPVPARH